MDDDKDLPLAMLTRDRIRLLNKYPFFGVLSLHLKPEQSSEVAVLETDGETLFYRPEAYKKLPSKTRQYHIAKQVLHCALGHIWRREGRNKKRWKLATDHAANLTLKAEGFDIPDNAPCDMTLRGLSVEEIYRRIPDTFPIDKDGGEEDGGEELKPPEHAEEKNGAESKRSSEKRPKRSDKTEQAPQTWEKRRDKAADIARGQNKLSSGLAQTLLGVGRAKLNWKHVLRNLILQAAKTDFQMLPPSKRHIWRQGYLPRLGGQMLSLVIAIDTSGSISTKIFMEFIAEITRITKQFPEYELHLVFCDAVVHDVMVLRTHNKWPTVFPKRSGGTNFRPVFEYVRQKKLRPMALVYLTDTEGDFPQTKPSYPVLWVARVEDPSRAKVPWGKLILMEDIDE